jgi:hypothetical protein
VRERQHRRIAVPAGARANQRLDGGGALNLMVVSADHRLLAADVRVRQQRQQLGSQVGRLREAHPGLPRIAWLPGCSQVAARHSIVQERSR